jgi:NADH dehydrogenase
LQIPRWDKRLRVMFDWTLDLVFPPELTQLKVGQPTPSMRPDPLPAQEKATAD